MGVKISAATPDASVTGVELVPVSDAGAAKSVTLTNIKQFTIDAIEAIAASGSIATADHIFTLQGGVMKPELVSIVAQHVIDQVWGKDAETAPDSLDIIALKDGSTEKTVTLALLAEYVRATVEAAILDISNLTAHTPLIAADKFLVTSGTTGKYCTFTVLSTAILASFRAYMVALAAVTVAADADIIYCSQGGVQKQVTRAIFLAGLGTTIAPGSTTEDNIPQWTAATKTLKDGKTVQTTVRAAASAVDTAIPTEKAVRTLASSIVYDQSDIGAALLDADAIIVDDGNLGTTQKKSTLTRVWAWLNVHYNGLSAKTVPVSNDVLTIQDSDASSAFKNISIGDLNSYLRSVTQDKVVLAWQAGQRGKPGINADIQNSAEATRMVTDPDFELLGTNAVSSDVTFNPEGGIIMETVGADGDEDILCPHLDANQSAWAQTTWGTDQNTRWECRIKTGASITNCIIWAGLKLTNTEVTATDDNQAFFRYEDDVLANWQAVSSIAGADTETDSGVIVAINTDYHFIIDIQNDRSAKFYIDDVLVYTTTPLTDATDLIPYIGVAADGAAAAKSLIIRCQAIRRDFA